MYRARPCGCPPKTARQRRDAIAQRVEADARDGLLEHELAKVYRFPDRIVLTVDEYDRLLDMLERPPAPTEALRALFRRG